MLYLIEQFNALNEIKKVNTNKRSLCGTIAEGYDSEAVLSFRICLDIAVSESRPVQDYIRVGGHGATGV